MTSIVIYAARPAVPDDGPTRRAGMIHAGGQLKAELIGADSSNDVEDAVNAVIGRYSDPDPAIHGNMQAVLEDDQGQATFVAYSINPGVGGKFSLQNVDDATDNQRKLRLRGEIDDFDSGNGGVYTMRTVAPRKAGDANAWAYLSSTILPDVMALVSDAITTGGTTKTDIENYLIATFAFTRCR